MVCGPPTLNGVWPRTSRLKDILNFADSRVFGSRHAAGLERERSARRKAKPARRSHCRKPPKPSGLALRQGRWRPILGVVKVRARRRGPGHQDAILARRARHREMFPPDGVWSRRPLFDVLGSAVGYGRLSIEPREPRQRRLQLMQGEALGASTIGRRSTSRRMASEQEDGEISADASPLRRPPGTM